MRFGIDPLQAVLRNRLTSGLGTPFAPVALAFLVISGVLISAGCSSMGPLANPAAQKTTDCLQLDWFELGRTEGGQGETLESIQEHLKSCQANKSRIDPLQFEAGHALGLNEFCTSIRGFEAGRGGQAYRGNCPWHLAGRFLVGFRLGERARSLELESQRLASAVERELFALPAELRRRPPEDVRTRIETLQGERAALLRELESIENDLTKSLL
jgi:hypothetical protein